MDGQIRPKPANCFDDKKASTVWKSNRQVELRVDSKSQMDGCDHFDEDSRGNTYHEAVCFRVQIQIIPLYHPCSVTKVILL